MAIPLIGKIVIVFLCLAVAGGLSTVIYFVVTADSDDVTTEQQEATTTPDPGAEDTSYLYDVGVGIADMTGPCVEITFMGYAELGQRGQGIHTRQFSRAFIFSKGDTRVVLVTADVQAVGLAVRREVVANLQELYGDMYTLRNVILTGTHTHSTPGGYLVDFILDVSILGFSSETFNAYVSGITRSIVRAHENMVPAKLFYGTTRVANAHMNRSPYSYEYNPPEEIARYENNTDDTLTQLRIVKQDGNLHGVLTWFSVHTTSLNMTNQLISSDNLGYAALKMESILNPGTLPGKGDVVAGFFSSILGDVSPNTRGAVCEFSGNVCDNQFLLCDSGERCFASGPGEDMYESAKIIGDTVLEGALEVLSSPGEELRGELAVVHQFVQPANETVSRYDTVARAFVDDDQVSGCYPAMGYSFASGTIDGANTLNITQGTLQGNPLLDTIGDIVAEATPEDEECHAPKPILLATGRANFPIPWHPHIISASVIWLGGLAVLGVPGEPTTMAGRRMRAAVEDEMERNGIEPRVVVSALTNEYIHYVTTNEEYQVQRYEAASTIYGPHTLDIFINKFVQFTKAAIEGSDVDAGPEPEDNRNGTISLILPVVADSAGFGRSFGQVLDQPPPTVQRGDTVTVSFVAANPRNDLRQESSHFEVQRFELGAWAAVATDASWETRFTWERQSTLLATSRVIINWTVPTDAAAGSYRVEYWGTARGLLGGLSNFTGVTDTFTINAA
ncbi:neutral ceramidase-like [Ostrinia nubilalis]|uniref:neutral ceramidase-like n=1 Tax=Ostrinia nubilalis TaxID=29057 RepID=UPI0030825ACA